MKKFDVIVVGAGTAGCMTAKKAAKAGLEVGLIDRKKREEIGEKVCGDAIGKHHFDELGLAPPKGEELRSKIEGIRIYSPNMETAFTVRSQLLYGFILDRRLFGQRLLNDAIDAGATLFESTIATAPLLKDGFVTGITAKDMKNNHAQQLQSKVTVEASGFTAIIRKCLPPEMEIDLNVNNEDVEACYREIRVLKEHDYNPEFCEIYLNQDITPGGYHWVFPEGQNMVNAGLGVAMTKSFPNPKNQFYRRVLQKPMFRNSTVVKGGSWYVPTRRPLDCLTGNGIVLVGDSACQVNPIHGGGMGPSLIGGSLAGNAIVKAVEKGDVSHDGLWTYNMEYMRGYGAKQAGLDIFRLFLLKSVTDEEISHGMKYNLITENDVFKASMGENVHLNITEKTRRIFRGMGKLSMLVKLRDAANLLKAMKSHYWSYPDSTKGFEEWREKTNTIMRTAYSKLSKRHS